MIERLFEEERPCDSPAYRRYAQQIAEARQILDGQLDEEGRACLDQLTGAYLRQSGVEARDAFVQGFCAAVELLLESLRHGSG